MNTAEIAENALNAVRVLAPIKPSTEAGYERVIKSFKTYITSLHQGSEAEQRLCKSFAGALVPNDCVADKSELGVSRVSSSLTSDNLVLDM